MGSENQTSNDNHKQVVSSDKPILDDRTVRPTRVIRVSKDRETGEEHIRCGLQHLRLLGYFPHELGTFEEAVAHFWRESEKRRGMGEYHYILHGAQKRMELVLQLDR